MKKYTLTKEHRAQLKPWAEKWIANALSTKQMDDAERDICRDATARLYQAANLTPPKRVIFVRSPLEGTFVAGFEAARAYLKKTENLEIAPLPPMSEIFSTKPRPAPSSWVDYPAEDWHRLDKKLGLDGFGIACAREAYRMRSGGNQWSAYAARHAFFRHVAKLDLPIFAKWDAWEKLAEHSGPRWVHEEFCVISDRPEVLSVEYTPDPNGGHRRGRLHNGTGPATLYRDGAALYSWHGTRVPGKWVLDRGSITVEDCLTHPNVEERRSAAEMLGWDKVLAKLPHRVIQADADPMVGTLIECDLPEAGPSRFLKVKCGTGRDFVLSVPMTMRTALEANAWGFPGLTEEEIRNLEVRT